MKSLANVAILWIGTLVQGCALIVYPDDMRRVEHGATRASIERELGEPIESVASGKGKIATYSYRAFDPEKCPRGDVLAVSTMFILAAPFICGQRGHVVIWYGPDDTVENFDIKPLRE